MKYRSRYEIIRDILTSAEASWLSITELADKVGLSYSRAAREAKRLLSRNLMQRRAGKKAEKLLLLYKTSRKGKRVADQIRRVLSYLEGEGEP